MEYSFDEMIERLKALKKERKLTNEQLSTLSGVPFGTLNKILGSETKETNISTVIKLANAVGVPAKDLIFGKEQIHESNLSEDETELVNLFRRLTYKDQQRYIGRMEDTINSYSSAESTVPKKTTIYRAARSVDNHPAEIVETTKDFSKIPPTDIKF